MGDKITASAKQLARTVGTPTSISVTLPDGTTIEGRLAGMDAYTYLLIDTDGYMHVVHKSVPAVRINRPMSAEEQEATLAAYEAHLESTNVLPTRPTRGPA